MPNGTYGGVRGKETKVCQKNFRFPTYSIISEPSEPSEHSEHSVGSGHSELSGSIALLRVCERIKERTFSLK